jgi:hypothetical protein
MTSNVPKGSGPRKKAVPPDYREQLFNDGKIGPIDGIQVSTDRIVRVRGILYDLDLNLYHAGVVIPRVPKDPKTLYRRIVRDWLSRHPVLNKAEVRFTGGGIHVIPWFAEPVEIENDGDREQWAAIVQVVQAALPVDPQAPGITATTRAFHSTNSKNDSKVIRLKEGQPVSTDEVLALYEEMCSSPFKTVMTILTGGDRISPCPVCNKPESSLLALDYIGRCYVCGKVNLGQLYDLVLRPRKPGAKGGQSRVTKAR